MTCDLPPAAKRLIQEVSAAPSYAGALILIRRFNGRLSEDQREALGAALSDLLRGDSPVTLTVIHEVTSNSPLGEPQPPFGEDYHWQAVHIGRDQTMWRRVTLQPDNRPAGGFEDFVRRNSPPLPDWAAPWEGDDP